MRSALALCNVQDNVVPEKNRQQAGKAGRHGRIGWRTGKESGRVDGLGEMTGWVVGTEWISPVDEVWNILFAVLNFGVLKRIQTPHSLLNFILGFQSR